MCIRDRLSDTTLERSMLTDFLAADYSVMQEGSFPACCSGGARTDPCMMSVSYTHLDVYKRQETMRTSTWELLAEYREQGGRLVFAGERCV